MRYRVPMIATACSEVIVEADSPADAIAKAEMWDEEILIDEFGSWEPIGHEADVEEVGDDEDV